MRGAAAGKYSRGGIKQSGTKGGNLQIQERKGRQGNFFNSAARLLTLVITSSDSALVVLVRPALWMFASVTNLFGLSALLDVLANYCRLTRQEFEFGGLRALGTGNAAFSTLRH